LGRWRGSVLRGLRGPRGDGRGGRGGAGVLDGSHLRHRVGSRFAGGSFKSDVGGGTGGDGSGEGGLVLQADGGLRAHGIGGYGLGSFIAAPKADGHEDGYLYRSKAHVGFIALFRPKPARDILRRRSIQASLISALPPHMNPDELVFGFLEYVVFLFSTTCHEAAHSLVARRGGDMTAHDAGQVSLNPLPHIRREPFGMVVMPLLGIVSKTGLIGWASAPYDPRWAAAYPKRAAWMSLAGPIANFSLAILAAILMRVGMAFGVFGPTEPFFSHMVQVEQPGTVMDGVATVLSVLFSLNILLGTFNLIPFPPLDGYGILGLFVSEKGALRLQEWRYKVGGMAILGLIVAWQIFNRVFPPVFDWATRVFYVGVRLG
jgi:Zn-dependent protease